MAKTLRRLAIVAGFSGATFAGITAYTAPPRSTAADRAALLHGALEAVPSRQEQLKKLRDASSQASQFDVLIIGGGATGCASALDASLRDLRVALVERDDFASGTSSRSTKLIHGGVRYLEKAFFQLDPGQLKLVFEALHERAIMLHQAPHLSAPLPTLLPCYKIWEVPFYWIGLKAYDIVAALGNGLLYMSKFVSASEAMRQFPTLNMYSQGQKLRGSIMYYDGQMDDARFNVGLAITSALYGAAVANHTEVTGLIHEDGRVCGAKCRDVFTGDEFDVRAKVVINATGPFTDSVRRMESEDVNPMIVPSAGVHITLPSYYSPDGMGLIVPKTKDGRVVFMLPWLGRTIAGTTDSSTKITALPRPHTAEVEFILDALKDYLRIDVRPSDVQSAWSGIRPLAVNPDADNSSTQNILREHAVHVSPERVVTITGGKWTTQRAMGEAAVDRAIEVGGLEEKATRCKTPFVQLIGAHKWDNSYFTFLTQRYEVLGHKPSSSTTAVASAYLDVACAKHLSRAYGDQAYKVAEIAESGHGARLVEGHPLIEAEVLYCVREEYCMTAMDFLARRSRLVFLDSKGALAALPRVVAIMATELKWSRERVRKEIADGEEMIGTFSCGIPEGK
ncbi:unnamed protein product [Agarophyton chilense]